MRQVFLWPIFPFYAVLRCLFSSDFFFPLPFFLLRAHSVSTYKRFSCWSESRDWFLLSGDMLMSLEIFSLVTTINDVASLPHSGVVLAKETLKIF